jgi:hypothetical protein
MKKKSSNTRIRLLFALLSAATPLVSIAAIVNPGAPVSIKQSSAYANFGGGDFVFSTSQGATGCEAGWYAKATDPGYKAIVATVLTAQSAGLLVTVYGDNADIWAGSPSGHFCRVQAVGISS